MCLLLLRILCDCCVTIVPTKLKYCQTVLKCQVEITGVKKKIETDITIVKDVRII